MLLNAYRIIVHLAHRGTSKLILSPSFGLLENGSLCAVFIVSFLQQNWLEKHCYVIPTSKGALFDKNFITSQINSCEKRREEAVLVLCYSIPCRDAHALCVSACSEC